MREVLVYTDIVEYIEFIFARIIIIHNYFATLFFVYKKVSIKPTLSC